MRKTLILTLVLCVFAVIAYAQTTGGMAPAAPATGTATTGTGMASTGTGAAAATTPAKATHKKKAAKSHSVKGTVASVDATAKSFGVHPAKGEDVTVKVNDKTKYSKGKTWDDVKADAKVTVSYHNDGTDNWALKVTFAAEPKAKAEKAAPKATGTGR
jgi:hypothetical protein